MQSVYTTLLVSLLATIIATVAGTFAAIGFYAMRRRVRNPLMTVNNIPMMNADIVTGVSMCLLFVAFFSGWGSFASWGALDAYRFIREDNTPIGNFLLCYADRFVEIRFDPWYDGAAPTEKQMALVGTVLGSGPLS